MTQVAKTGWPHPGQMPSWPGLPIIPFDILAALSQRLGGGWIAQRKTDCDGDVSILVMTVSDADNTMPTFILYKKHGLTHVAVVKDDEWLTQPGFASAQEAVVAIVVETAGLSVTASIM